MILHTLLHLGASTYNPGHAVYLDKSGHEIDDAPKDREKASVHASVRHLVEQASPMSCGTRLGAAWARREDRFKTINPSLPYG
jgi:hypothetical protein